MLNLGCTIAGVFRSVSPPPMFTSVKHLMSSQETKEVSVLSGESLLDPVSAEDSGMYYLKKIISIVPDSRNKL